MRNASLVFDPIQREKCFVWKRNHNQLEYENDIPTPGIVAFKATNTKRIRQWEISFDQNQAVYQWESPFSSPGYTGFREAQGNLRLWAIR